MDNYLLKIGEIAAFFNVSVKAIRIYEKKGILKPAKIDPQTGYRYYTVDQVQQLNALLELKQLGFSLLEIKMLLECGMSNEQFAQALVHKKTAWQNIVANAQYKIEAIEKISERLSSSEPAVKMHELSQEERAWLLVKMVCVEDLNAKKVLSEAIWL